MAMKRMSAAVPRLPMAATVGSAVGSVNAAKWIRHRGPKLLPEPRAEL
jgi:hypothetical protein